MPSLPIEVERSPGFTSVDPWKRLLRLILVYACFFAVAVALHYPGLHAPAIYDTEVLLLGNGHYFSQHDIQGVIGITPQRPLFMASLYANYLLSGMDAASFRIVNAAILAAAGVALSWLIAVLLDICSMTRQLGDREKLAICVLVGLIFVVHPLQRLVVLYIWQREAIMSCFFSYAALASYLTGRSRMQGKGLGWYIGTSLLMLGGITSKENVMSFPLVAMAAEWILFPQTLRNRLKQGMIIVSIVAVPFMIQVILVNALQQPQTPADHEGIFNRLQSYYDKVQITFLQIVLTECRVWFTYLFSIVAPFVQRIQLLRAEVISRSLWSPPVTAAAVAGIGGLAALALGISRKRPLSALGILFFMLALVPESLLIPQYLFCGYRAILPMAGVLMVGADGLAVWLSNPDRRVRRAATIVPLLFIVCLSVTTFSQAKRWHPFPFWQEAYADLPEYSPDVEKFPYVDVLTSYAIELSRSGVYDQAIRLFEQAAELGWDRLGDKQALAMGNLGLTLIQSGRQEEGIAYLREVVRRFPQGSWARYNLGVALFGTGKKDEGVRLIRKAVDLSPDDADARVALGDVLCSTGHYDQAIEQYTAALKLKPRSGRIYRGLAHAWKKAGRLDRAVANYNHALLYSADPFNVYIDLGQTLVDSGNREEAVLYFEKAVALKPNSVPALANLGTLFLEMGRTSEATTYLQQAAAIAGNNAELYYRLGKALAQVGRNPEALAALDRAMAIDPRHTEAQRIRDSLKNTVSGGS